MKKLRLKIISQQTKIHLFYQKINLQKYYEYLTKINFGINILTKKDSNFEDNIKIKNYNKNVLDIEYLPNY